MHIFNVNGVINETCSLLRQLPLESVLAGFHCIYSLTQFSTSISKVKEKQTRNKVLCKHTFYWHLINYNFLYTNLTKCHKEICRQKLMH